MGVSVFPVGFSGGLKFEGPICVNGSASEWHVAWDPKRSEFNPLELSSPDRQLDLETYLTDILI